MRPPSAPPPASPEAGLPVLLAEDDADTREALADALAARGYSPVLACDGAQALAQLRRPDGPRLAVLDWMMPALTGPEVCRQLRAGPEAPYVYVLLLTARRAPQDVAEALDAGADDFLPKPVVGPELWARLRVGERMLRLETRLRQQVEALQEAQSQVQRLEGLLPICMHCKRIRDEEGTWQQVERYVSQRSAAAFSHGLCQACLEEHYPE